MPSETAHPPKDIGERCQYLCLVWSAAQGDAIPLKEIVFP